VFWAAFLQLQFGLVTFWHMSISAKAASKILMNLNTRFIFTNNLSEQVFPHIVHVCIFLAKIKEYWCKTGVGNYFRPRVTLLLY